MSSLLKELGDIGGDIHFGEEQEVQLKGLAGLNRVYTVEWGSSLKNGHRPTGDGS